MAVQQRRCLDAAEEDDVADAENAPGGPYLGYIVVSGKGPLA